MARDFLKRRVLFHRFFNTYNGGTSGGQIKVRDSFEHLRTSDLYDPKVYFNPNTVWFENPGNVWIPYRNTKLELKDWEILPNDLLFFAGTDWNILSESEKQSPPVPIINIVHPRHCRPNDKRNQYLKYPAIRITKSSISKKILEKYGVNGPIFVFPDAIDPKDIPLPEKAPKIDILIVGLKNPGMAKKIYRKLKWKNFFRAKKLKIAIQLPPKLPTRKDFLDLVNDAKTIVYLPLEEKYGSEGFYLPALEGMFLKKLVICPYAVGNSDFCIPNKTCIMPDYSFESILNSVQYALSLSTQQRDKIITQALEITKNHHISKERKDLTNLLEKSDDIWTNKTLFISNNKIQ